MRGAGVGAGPANVTVRVEGDSQTLVPATRVATDTTPVLVEGSDSCSGTSAGGALVKATGGDVGGEWGGFGFQLFTVKGETHNDPFPADPSRYWSFWVNYTYQDQGLCSTELQDGDEVLLFVDCFSSTAQCDPTTPLRLSGVPATIAPGQPFTVKVEEFTTVYDPVANKTSTTPEPAEDATVTAAGQTVTTGADGTAQLTLSGGGPVTIAVSEARAGAHRCRDVRDVRRGRQLRHADPAEHADRHAGHGAGHDPADAVLREPARRPGVRARQGPAAPARIGDARSVRPAERATQHHAQGARSLHDVPR